MYREVNFPMNVKTNSCLPSVSINGRIMMKWYERIDKQLFEISRLCKICYFLLKNPSSARRIFKSTDVLRINRYVAPLNQVNLRNFLFICYRPFFIRIDSAAFLD